jgi:hypothetical protein
VARRMRLASSLRDSSPTARSIAVRTEFMPVSLMDRAEDRRVARVESMAEDPVRWKQSSLAPAW